MLFYSQLLLSSLSSYLEYFLFGLIIIDYFLSFLVCNGKKRIFASITFFRKTTLEINFDLLSSSVFFSLYLLMFINYVILPIYNSLYFITDTALAIPHLSPNGPTDVNNKHLSPTNQSSRIDQQPASSLQ